MADTNATAETQPSKHQDSEPATNDTKSEQPSTTSPSPTGTISPTTDTLTKTVIARHSTRAFLPRPVPMDLLNECLQLAQSSPSSTNLQPWRLTVTTGSRLDKLRKALVHAVESGVKSTVPPIPEEYKHYRSGVGHDLYGPQGYNVSREDREGTTKARMRNYTFFEAPMVIVIGIEESLYRSGADVMSVGLYVQTLILLLTERGLGTCAEVSTAGYGDVIKKEMGIKENVVVLSTLAVGYADESQQVNRVKMARDGYKDHVNFVIDE